MMSRLLLFLLLGAAVPLAAQSAPQDTLPTAPLTLLDAIRLGQRRGLPARIARANAGLTEARIRQRRAEVLPSVTGALAATRQTLNLDEFGIPVATGLSEPFSIYRARLSVQQALFDASAFTRLRAAHDTARAGALDAKAVGELAGAVAGLAWLRVQAARETVRARLADSAVAASLLSQARSLVEAGVSPRIDATRSELNVATVRTQLEIARNQDARNQLDLRRALDLDAGATLVLADSIDIDGGDIPATGDAAEAYALLHRTELAAERARIAAAQRTLSAIRAEGLPSAFVGGFVQESGRTIGGARGTWSAQLGISIPIIDGFRRDARRDEQQTRVVVATLRANDAARQVALDARQAIVDLTSSDEQLRLADERLRLAEQELQEAQERFISGVAGSLETTAAQGSLLAARDARIQARVARGAARVATWRALGLIETLP